MNNLTLMKMTETPLTGIRSLLIGVHRIMVWIWGLVSLNLWKCGGREILNRCLRKTNRLLAIMIDIPSRDLIHKEILYHHLGSSPGTIWILSQWPIWHNNLMYHRMLGFLDLLINSSPIHFKGRHLPIGQQVLDMISVSIINFNIRSHQRREELTLTLLWLYFICFELNFIYLWSLFL